jgi:hypothetical protein
VWTGEKRQAGALSSPFFLSRSDAGRLLRRLLLKTTQTQLVVLFSSNKGEQVTRYFMMIELNFDRLILHFIAASWRRMCPKETEVDPHASLSYIFAKLKYIQSYSFVFYVSV